MAKSRAEAAPPVLEELHFRSDNAFLCLLLNRRNKFIRVIDFRAGALPAKRLFIQSIAKREGVEKVITLVEKDEVSSWTRVGFVREGTIPGFYKRSDGHLCGCVIGERTAALEVNEDTMKLAEKTIVAGKKYARDPEEEIRSATLRDLTEHQAHVVRDQVWAKGTGMGTFDPFGRGAERVYLEAAPKSKSGKANIISAEFQDCFGHSLVEILRSPDGEQEVLAVTHGLRHMAEELKKRGIISAFGFAPSEDVALGTAYLGAGFRKTGLLARGIMTGPDKRSDAILWTRKLANPAGEDGVEGP